MKSILNRVFRMLIGAATAQMAGVLFRQVWKLIADEEHTPLATDPERSMTEVALGGLLQGAIFGVIQALLSRGGATGVEKMTGERPGHGS